MHQLRASSGASDLSLRIRRIVLSDGSLGASEIVVICNWLCHVAPVPVAFHGWPPPMHQLRAPSVASGLLLRIRRIVLSEGSLGASEIVVVCSLLCHGALVFIVFHGWPPPMHQLSAPSDASGLLLWLRRIVLSECSPGASGIVVICIWLYHGALVFIMFHC